MSRWRFSPRPGAKLSGVYAAYGGVFVIMSLLWGWRIDGHTPDNYDWLGAAIVAVGRRRDLLRAPAWLRASAHRFEEFSEQLEVSITAQVKTAADEIRSGQH